METIDNKETLDMTVKTFSQIFVGYWTKDRISGIPGIPGIYCVYECTYCNEKKNVIIQRLLYIGESDNVSERIKNHELSSNWKEYLREGNELCFNFSPADNSMDRKRVEAAMIFRYKPPLNIDYTKVFPYDLTRIDTYGDRDLLEDFFVVNPDRHA